MMIRPPAVAGRFYPSDPAELRRSVREMLDAAETSDRTPLPPKALIAPHAGYGFSGPIAASAYASLRSARETIRRVVLLGTAHSPVSGLATSRADGFETPMGVVPIDRDALHLVEALPQVSTDDRAQRADHALEVQLPFLQEALERFAIVPFLVGRCDPGEVAEVLERLWGGEETLIVVSSDLSHYLDYESGRRMDRSTAASIEKLRSEDLRHGRACGHRAIAGLIEVARRRGLQASTLDLRSSGDTGGPLDRVVGYGAFLFEPGAAVPA